jgi:hypothetical protein
MLLSKEAFSPNHNTDESLIQKPNRELYLRKANEDHIIQLARNNIIVNWSIDHATKGKGQFGFDTSKFTPEAVKQFRKMNELKLSLANPDLPFDPTMFDKDLDQKDSIIQTPDQLEVSCAHSNVVYRGREEILRMIENKIPGFIDKERVLMQGSASRPCEQGFDIKRAMEMARNGKLLISGGTGMPGSAMYNYANKMLEEGGYVIFITLPELTDSSAEHYEHPIDMVKPEYRDKVLSLVAKDLWQRLALFHFITTLGEENFGEVIFDWGGNGTFAELYAILLQLKISPKLGTFRNINLTETGLWNDPFKHFVESLNLIMSGDMMSTLNKSLQPLQRSRPSR